MLLAFFVIIVKFTSWVKFFRNKAFMKPFLFFSVVFYLILLVQTDIGYLIVFAHYTRFYI